MLYGRLDGPQGAQTHRKCYYICIKRRAYMSTELMLNLRPPGGGGRIGTNPVFLNNVRSVTGISAKLGVPLDTLILRPFTKF